VNAKTRRIALYGIGVIAVLGSLDALAHSYAGLYGWALHHRLSGWQAWSWPAEIDVFLVVGELALYVAYLDGWPSRQRVWPWVTAVTGLAVSVVGNAGRIQPLPGVAVTMADRITAATSPVAAFAGLMIGLLVIKMGQRRFGGERRATEVGVDLVAANHPAAVAGGSAAGSKEDPAALPDPRSPQHCSILQDAVEIFEAGSVNGQVVSRRALAAQLRERGHQFSNSQLSAIANAAAPAADRRAA
jgi:hypothetical protein